MQGSPKVLLVRFSAIGDCVMAAWAATAIRNRHPNAMIVWAIESRCSAVVDCGMGKGRLASELAEFPRDRWKAARWSPQTWRSQLIAFTRLRRYGFDFGYDLQGHSKTALCLRLARPAQRIAACATDPLSAKLNPQAPPRPAGIHTVEWNHEVVRSFEPFELPKRPIMPSVRGRSASSSRRLATISTGAGQPEKAYPLAQWLSVARELLQMGFEVEFLGGPTDPVPSLPGAVSHVGKIPLADTMALVAQSQIHLAADTGTGHMAAAYGVPVVSVFGQKDPREFRPYTTRGRVLKNGGVPGDVKPSEILEAVGELLESQISD